MLRLPTVAQTHRFVQSDYGGSLIHGWAVAVTGWGGGGTEVLMVWTARASGPTGPEWAVALRATVVHRLHQDPVDLLAQLDNVGRGDPILVSLRRREHVFIQRAPGDGGIMLDDHLTQEKYTT